ncbi:MAG: DUF4037 domain-containing protein [Anaerovoracaceae bacterium]|jgi:tetratricopeptide (TPR) repeat protein
MERENFFGQLDEFFNKGDIGGAETFLLEALEEAANKKDLPALLAIANELGGILRVTSRLKDAQKIYEIALDTIRVLGLENTEQHGTTLINLGTVYTEMDMPSKAMEVYEKAERIFKGNGRKGGYALAALYNNMSHALDKLNDDVKALNMAEKAMDIVKELKGYEIELATSYTTLGTRYIKLKRYEEGEKCLKKAEDIFLKQKGKPDPHYGATLNSLGELYMKLGRGKVAAEYFEKALAIVSESYGKGKTYREISANLDRVRQKPLSIRDSLEIKRMSGMELARGYYEDFGRRAIEKAFPQYMKYMAFGLVGEGSDCFGFDDSISESHDFGPGFCIWLPEEVFKEIGPKVQSVYEALPAKYMGKSRIETPQGAGRVGVFSIKGFYRKHMGSDDIPHNNLEWLFIPESSLAAAVNGQVFEDNLGEFSRIRSGLMAFYPRDIWLKKLVVRMVIMSQSGQYNYPRAMNRREYATAYLCCSEFIKSAASAIYLLNQRYMPFYKWIFRGMNYLNSLKGAKQKLEFLAATLDAPENAEAKTEVIEEVCLMVRDELNLRGITDSRDAFLHNLCSDVNKQIEDLKVRNLPILVDGR